MAETLLSFGVQKLWDLLVRESDRLKGVDEKITELKSDLNLLRSFLKDAYAKKYASDLVRNCMEETNEIILDAEDVIETFLLKEELGRTSGIRKRMRRRAFSIVVCRKFSSNIGGISKRISKVIRNMKDFGVKQMVVDGNRYSEPLQERQREMRHTFPSNNETNLVGLEKNVKKLVGYLVEEDCIQVVSICGMGGIGKTTLARQVYNHEMVKNYFDGVVWLCISQQFSREYVWQTILHKLSSKHDEHRNSCMSHMSEDELQCKLFQLLETSKSLIVLDDMWKEEDWDRIKHVFPPTKEHDNKTFVGWKVILTSRNERVALHADPTCVTYKPECLTPEESWTLLRRKAFPMNDTTQFKVDEEMEEMGKKMIKHCGGLPLALNVLGGLLASQHTLSEWKRVYENIRSHVVCNSDFREGNHNSVHYVLSLSFEELPNSLKHCFLYLAHFPEDYLIDMETLSYYWAAEETLMQPENYERASVRDVADMYIEELVNRNMVMSERDHTTSRFETCQMHDMMREVCLLKAKEENFLEISNNTSSTSSKSPYRSRRLVVHCVDNMERYITNPKLRSFLSIRDTWGEAWMVSNICFTQLQLMRVLDISYAKFEGGKLPSSIGNLIHLRYLSLYMSVVTHIPSSVRNLKKLLYLNLCLKIVSRLYVPNILIEMQELKYLSLPSGKMHHRTKLELGNLINLETLENFSTDYNSLEDLQGMTRLKTLSIRSSYGQNIMKTLSSSLSQLSQLESLTIEPIYIYDRNYDDKAFVCDYVHAKQLYLKICMPRLPDEQHLSSHLTIICLQNCGLEEDPMLILEKLFHLQEVYLQSKSFVGKRMVCSRGGFPQLQKLHFYKLEEWEEWIVEEGSMPFIHTLQISYCVKLKELPEGLRFITSLKELTIVCIGEEWKEETFLEGGEDYYKVEHIPSLIFRYGILATD